MKWINLFLASQAFLQVAQATPFRITIGPTAAQSSLSSDSRGNSFKVDVKEGLLDQRISTAVGMLGGDLEFEVPTSQKGKSSYSSSVGMFSLLNHQIDLAKGSRASVVFYYVEGFGERRIVGVQDVLDPGSFWAEVGDFEKFGVQWMSLSERKRKQILRELKDAKKAEAAEEREARLKEIRMEIADIQRELRQLADDVPLVKEVQGPDVRGLVTQIARYEAERSRCKSALNDLRGELRRVDAQR